MNANLRAAHIQFSCTFPACQFIFGLQSAASWQVGVLAVLCCSISSSVRQLLARADEKEFGIKGFSHFLTVYFPASGLHLQLTLHTWLTDSWNWAENADIRLTSCACFLFPYFPLLCYFIYCLYLYSNDFSRMVAEEYLSFFNFTGLALDQALRWDKFNTRNFICLQYMKVNTRHKHIKYMHVRRIINLSAWILYFPKLKYRHD